MLPPLRGWRIAVQYHFLNRHSSCGDAVICHVEQFSAPKKRNSKTHASGYPKNATAKLTPPNKMLAIFPPIACSLGNLDQTVATLERFKAAVQYENPPKPPQ